MAKVCESCGTVLEFAPDDCYWCLEPIAPEEDVRPYGDGYAHVKCYRKWERWYAKRQREGTLPHRRYTPAN